MGNRFAVNQHERNLLYRSAVGNIPRALFDTLVAKYAQGGSVVQNSYDRGIQYALPGLTVNGIVPAVKYKSDPNQIAFLRRLETAEAWTKGSSGHIIYFAIAEGNLFFSLGESNCFVMGPGWDPWYGVAIDEMIVHARKLEVEARHLLEP